MVVLLFVAWGLLFIRWTSVEVDGERFYLLHDDAMISMTHARNLVEGYGPSWARYGTPVEGSTCPLWTFVMIPVNALPVDLGIRSLFIQLLSLALLAANLFAVAGLARDHFGVAEERSFLPAVAMTALYYPLGFWALFGMETGLQALLVTTAVHQALSLGRGTGGSWWVLGAILAAALLLRPDLMLLAAACVAFVAWRRRLRRSDAHSWTLLAAVASAPPSAYLAFRWFYYGDLLPNTYYLKLTGMPLTVRLARGLGSMVDEFFQHNLLVMLVLFIGAAVLARRRARYFLPAAIIALQFAYVIYAGGDNKAGTIEGGNRFVAPVMPLAFIVLNGLSNQLLHALRELPLQMAAVRATDLRRAWWAFLVLAVTVQVNGLHGHQGAAAQWRRLLFLADNPFGEVHRHLVQKTRQLEELVAHEAIVAVSWAGIPAYFSRFRMADILGYNDRHVARLDLVMELDLGNADRYQPGHLKWDWDYLLSTVRPDVIFQVPKRLRKAPDLEQRLLAQGYFRRDRYLFRRDSEHLKFEPGAAQEPAVMTNDRTSRHGAFSSTRPPSAS